MNCVVEKWITIAALTGWIGSMGSMVVLAVSAPSVNPVVEASQRFAARDTDGVKLSERVKLTEMPSALVAEPKSINEADLRSTKISLDSAQRHWLDQGEPRITSISLK
jgi:hypothetical protein